MSARPTTAIPPDGQPRHPCVHHTPLRAPPHHSVATFRSSLTVFRPSQIFLGDLVSDFSAQATASVIPTKLLNHRRARKGPHVFSRGPGRFREPPAEANDPPHHDPEKSLASAESHARRSDSNHRIISWLFQSHMAKPARAKPRLNAVRVYWAEVRVRCPPREERRQNRTLASTQGPSAYECIGTVLKSTNHRPCRPKIYVFYSIRASNIGGENKT